MFGVLWSIKGDLDFFAKALALRHYGANKPCDWCPCDKDKDKLWWPNNFLASALWQTSLTTAEEWRLANPHPHWLFQIPFLSNLNVEPDELHVLYLGTHMYLIGSVLRLLVYRNMPNDPPTNMGLVWDMITSFYSDNDVPTQFSKLSLSSFHDPQKPKGDYPRLKGKGAEIKCMLHAITFVWTHFQRGNAIDNKILNTLTAAGTLQGLIDEYSKDLFFPYWYI